MIRENIKIISELKFGNAFLDETKDQLIKDVCFRSDEAVDRKQVINEWIDCLISIRDITDKKRSEHQKLTQLLNILSDFCDNINEVHDVLINHLMPNIYKELVASNKYEIYHEDDEDTVFVRRDIYPNGIYISVNHITGECGVSKDSRLRAAQVYFQCEDDVTTFTNFLWSTEFV